MVTSFLEFLLPYQFAPKQNMKINWQLLVCSNTGLPLIEKRLPLLRTSVMENFSADIKICLT